ncbi:MAG: hypothetical protein AB7G06_03965 [Bdellovibrionales bacterium]
MQQRLRANSKDQKHVVFSSGGGFFCAFGGGLQEAAAYGDEKCPDVYVVYSGGLINALARAAAEDHITDLADARGAPLSNKERGDIIHKIQVYVWDKIEKDFGPRRSVVGKVSQAVLEQMVMHGSYSSLLFAKNEAISKQIGRNAVEQFKQMLDPWMPFGVRAADPWIRAAQDVATENHFWATYLRNMFAEIDIDIDKVIANPKVPRIIAVAHDYITDKPVYLDTRPAKGEPATLGQLVATMSIPNPTGMIQPVMNRLVDGGITGFNGDSFEVMLRLMREDPAYGDAKVTFVNLGKADICTEEQMLSLNPNYLKNQARARISKDIIQKMFAYRELHMDRTGEWKSGKDKFVPREGVIAKLREQGREHYRINHKWRGPSPSMKGLSIDDKIMMLSNGLNGVPVPV